MTPHPEGHSTRRLVAAATTGLAAALAAVLPAAPTPAAAATSHPLTNLAHLDWLTTQVSPPTQAEHTTYQLGSDPNVGVLWTYAEPDGSGWKHVGGGTYSPATNTWGQGAYNADDIARAAVVYLRHWRATGSATSRHEAYELLRGLTYLQTATGPNAGNVVLWMQPDGTLNRSADPKDVPDPSDSGPSYWLARTLWALGEGYADFKKSDPAFAAFLRNRLDLSVAGLDRQVLVRYGQYLDIDGQKAPAWLIADGADASAEGVLGLSAYVAAGGSAPARTALMELSNGIAALSDGNARTWPYGAIRPWALSRSEWHGWGAQMPAALARAARVVRNRSWAAAAAKDSFTFDPWLFTSGGPDNGRLPTRGDRSQIAYGADSRVESLVATGEGSSNRGVRRGAYELAGIAGGWFFGANPAGKPMYDPSTGVTYDGISPDGTVNTNSGAESTIHGLLAMLALDAHRRAAAIATSATSIASRVGTLTVEAEQAQLSGDAHPVTPAALWTGESLFSGTGYAALGSGSRATFALPPHPRSLVLPVVERQPGSSAVTQFGAAGRSLGSVRSGDIGAQGDSPAPGALLPTTLPAAVPAGVTQLTATTSSSGGDTTSLDALMLEPVVSRLVLAGHGHGTALLSSRAQRTQHVTVDLSGTGSATVESFAGNGHLVRSTRTHARRVSVSVPAGGFALVRR